MAAYKLPNWQGRTEWGALERDRAIAGMRYFDEVLSRHAYIAGDKFSMADITVYAGLYFADIGKIAIPGACESLRAWRGRISERASVKNPA